MEDLHQVCQEIVQEYHNYFFTEPTDLQKKIFASLKKFSKAVEEVGLEDEIFSKSLDIFWDNNKNSFSRVERKTWFNNNIQFHLYDAQGKILKGKPPVSLHLSGLYVLARKVEEITKVSPGENNSLSKRLEKALFTVLISKDESFSGRPTPLAVAGQASANIPGMPFDLSKIGDLLGNLMNSGLIPGAEGVDRQEMSNAINGIMTDPRVGGLIQSVAAILQNPAGETGNTSTSTSTMPTLNTDNLIEVLQTSLNKGAEEKEPSA